MYLLLSLLIAIDPRKYQKLQKIAAIEIVYQKYWKEFQSKIIKYIMIALGSKINMICISYLI